MRNATSAVARLVPVVLLAACGTPPLSLRFKLTDGDSQKCTSNTGQDATSCSDISLLCPAVLSVRVVPPGDPDFPYISVCKPLVGAQGKLCAIAGVDLPPPTTPIPEQTLEVQMAVFQRDALAKDLDGNYICPRVQFGANNLPEAAVSCNETDEGSCPVRPAIGGRAFYYPGDSETVVELGCTEPALLTAPECAGSTSIEVSATINDFDTNATVGEIVADRLEVSVGEPRLNSSGFYELTSTFTRPLSRPGDMGSTWSGETVDLDLQNTFCIEVFEDVAQATRTVTCQHFNDLLTRLDATGVRLDKNTLAQILTALGEPSFPDEGLVVGVVLNELGVPVTGTTVAPSCMPGCSIKYLSADRMTMSSGPTAMTSSNGIWVSTDASYPAEFAAVGQTRIGGLVLGKVTIVILQDSTTVGM